MSAGAVFSAWTLTLALVSGPAAVAPSSRSTGDGQAAVGGILDVPFVPQSEALCGGAAAAMVLRYWKSAPVFAEDFASLVTETAEGITLGDLARAVRDRGWRALPFAGTSADLQSHLARGRPVIALIEDRPGRNHYVVAVAWTSGRIVFHDPARGPFRVVEHEQFERAWAATGHTTLLILPEESPVAPAGPTHDRQADSPAPDACGPSLDHAVALARDGDLNGADALLRVVSASCPRSSGGPRELAGIRFLEKRWAEAAVLAELAVARDPLDMHAWQLLATARFLDGDSQGALVAWNRRQEPRLDLTRIDGLDRTRHDVVANLADLTPQTLLTGSRMRRAARRVAALPVVRASRVSYSPASGIATVDIAVVERPLIPNTWASLAAVGVHAATAREARLDVASPTGNGELWTGSARWWARRPRVSFSLATPTLWRWSGLWRVEGSWERQTYAPASNEAAFESNRRHAGVTFADWTSGDFRWEVSGALDHWDDRGRQVAAGAALERRLVADRVAVRAQATLWPRWESAAAFGSGVVATAFRSMPEGQASWTGVAAMYFVTAAAPLDVWPGVDTGHARPPLLRAHPLLSDGVIRAAGVGRALAHGTIEFRHRVMLRPLGQLHVAAFADVAKLARTRVDASVPIELDIGTGVRVSIPGAPGIVRLDIAKAIRDGNVVLSAAWQAPWPGW